MINSLWSEILFRVSQRSILESLLFIIFICFLFYFLEVFDIANYAVDSAPYYSDKSAKFIVSILEQSPLIFFELLSTNCILISNN